MKFISQKTITFFYILISIILISTVVAFVVSRQRLKVAGDLVEHTQEVLRKSDNVLLNILNIETASRGYVLTANEIFLGPFYKATDSISQNLLALAEVTKEVTFEVAALISVIFPSILTVKRGSLLASIRLLA